MVTGILTGCVPSLKGNDPREPNKALPASFVSTPTTDATDASKDGAAAAKETWANLFGSAELRALIDTALANNRELSIQLQEIVIAENEVSARQGEVMPKVNAGAGVGVEKVGKYTSQGKSDEAAGVPENLGNFAFGLTGSWEVDIWKKLRNAAKAAGYRYFATVEAKNFMVTQIVAEIARSYYELVALDNQVDILKKNIELQSKALEVVKVEKEAARVTELAVQRFEAEVLKNRSRLYDVEQERIRTENRINFLVGRYPQPVARRADALDTALPEGIQSGLPTRLLENRPDVRRAALELEAAKLDVQVAKAAFYPSLTIDAGVGYRSFNAAHLVSTPESLGYGLAGSLSAPLLNRAAITAEYRSSNARQIQAVYEYEKTLLQAFTDVATQLSTIANLQKSYTLQAEQVDTLARSVEISGVLFQSARADYMEVLLTRRDSLEAQVEIIETKRRKFQAVVALYQALGGGWRKGK
jgi:NodT family efflux transporter outer membrane factor (OMF) lipoprotein